MVGKSSTISRFFAFVFHCTTQKRRNTYIHIYIYITIPYLKDSKGILEGIFNISWRNARKRDDLPLISMGHFAMVPRSCCPEYPHSEWFVSSSFLKINLYPLLWCSSVLELVSIATYCSFSRPSKLLDVPFESKALTEGGIMEKCLGIAASRATLGRWWRVA